MWYVGRKLSSLFLRVRRQIPRATPHRTMGSFVSCEKCTNASSANVVTFTNDLVSKLCEGVDPPPIDHDDVTKLGTAEDQALFRELHCIDKSHSLASGLSLESFNSLAQSLEDVFHAASNSEIAHLEDDIICCYDKNKHCTLKCAENVDNYVDYIESSRLRKIIKHVVCRNKVRRQYNNTCGDNKTK